ncbi:MAG: rRNA processing protein RimM [Thermosediminibacterales bacterium]|nr:rRNA processing protein RimM [Thermosediminibacterales bacterium]MDK2901414.1 rRNA processing protein RimM [Thermosediminibacterales bacterium]
MNYLIVGKILSTQGNKGEVKVWPLTDDITRFEKLKTVYIDIENKLQPFGIERVWYHKNFIILKFLGINTIEEGQKLKNCYIKIRKEDAIKLPPGHYFLFEIIDSKVITMNGEFLGIITEIIKTGSNDVYVVKQKSGKEIYIPAIKEVVKEIDIKNKIVKIELLEGLV